MIARRSAVLVLGGLISGLAISAHRSTSTAEQELTELICSAAAPEEPHRVGDAPIIHGFLVSGGGELGFRPCNSSDIFFIQAPVTLWDTLHDGSPTDVLTDRRYLRFHGAELECTSAIPAPYVGGVRIDEILAAGTSPPANCK